MNLGYAGTLESQIQNANKRKTTPKTNGVVVPRCEKLPLLHGEYFCLKTKTIEIGNNQRESDPSCCKLPSNLYSSDNLFW